jgi:hypothetical protein
VFSSAYTLTNSLVIKSLKIAGFTHILEASSVRHLIASQKDSPIAVVGRIYSFACSAGQGIIFANVLGEK